MTLAVFVSHKRLSSLSEKAVSISIISVSLKFCMCVCPLVFLFDKVSLLLLHLLVASSDDLFACSTFCPIFILFHSFRELFCLTFWPWPRAEAAAELAAAAAEGATSGPVTAAAAAAAPAVEAADLPRLCQGDSPNLVQAFFHLHCVHHWSRCSIPYTLRHFLASPLGLRTGDFVGDPLNGFGLNRMYFPPPAL